LHSSDTGERMGYNETVHQVFVNFKKAYDSVRREVLCNIITEFRLSIQNGLKQGDALLPLLFNFAS
jgi:hypothetical protein